MVVSTKEEKPGAWRGGEEGFTDRDICVKEQGRGICECLEERPGQKMQLVKMPGVPEMLSSGVNERGVGLGQGGDPRGPRGCPSARGEATGPR